MSGAPHVKAVQKTLPPEATSVAAARLIAAATCTHHGIDAGARDTIVLLVSELVTNAVLHGDGPIRFSIHVDTRMVCVDVGDDSDLKPRLKTQGPDVVGGQGLRMVAAMADRWGVRTEPVGKTVWFEIETPGLAVPARDLGEIPLAVPPILHASDGDGTPVCAGRRPADSELIAGLAWAQVEDQLRCPACTALLGENRGALQAVRVRNP